MTKTATTITNAINWMIERSAVVFDSTDEFDGQMIHATTRQFEGKLPGRMGDEIRTWLKVNAVSRDTNRQTAYNFSLSGADYSVTMGAYKSTFNSMRLIENKYEVVHVVDEYNAEWLAYS